MKQYNYNSTDDIIFIANLDGKEELIDNIKQNLIFTEEVEIFNKKSNIHYINCMDYSANEKITPDIQKFQKFCFYCDILFKNRINSSSDEFTERDIKTIFGHPITFDVLHFLLTSLKSILLIMSFDDEEILNNLINSIKKYTKIEIKYEIEKTIMKIMIYIMEILNLLPS